MSIVLVDTDVISYLFKGDTRAQLYAPYLYENHIAISFMTIAELFQWAAIHQWGDLRKEKLEATINNYLVLPFHIDVCKHWGDLRAHCRAAGHPISPQDAWIAATALHYAIPW